jgi:hypothetical protein
LYQDVKRKLRRFFIFIWLLNSVQRAWEVVPGGQTFMCPVISKHSQNSSSSCVFDRYGIQTMRMVTSIVQLEVRSHGQDVISFN